MGREQRSRRYLLPGAICYLCGQPITPDQRWDRDHIPPKRVFGDSIKKRHAVDLEWLPSHVACNSAYKLDEEYFVVSLVGHHHTPTARSVWEDVRRGAAHGHSLGLIKTIAGQFGKVVLPDGSVLFGLDTSRSHRVAWKIVRGLYTLLSGRFLPDNQLRLIQIVPESEAERRLTGHDVFAAVRDTPSLGKHGAVFDYKWLCVKDGDFRDNLVAMLFWNGLIVFTLFHDPACRCADCSSSDCW
jgi:hypothetical protein